MSAAIHLVLGPPGAGRLHRLVSHYCQAAKEFQSALFLTPSQRHAESVRQSLRVTIVPRIHDIQSVADELVRTHEPGLRPHSDGDRQLLMASILTELRGELPYFAGVAETRGYAESAMGYVQELKNAGVELRQVLKLSPSQEPGVPPNRHAQAVRIFERYQRRTMKLHRLDPSDRLRTAVELWKAGHRQPFEGVRTLFLAGFTSFSPLQRKFIEALRETLEHLWIELPEGAGQAFTEPLAARKWLTSGGRQRTLFDSGQEVAIERVDFEETKPAGLKRLAKLFDCTPAALEKCAGIRLIEAPGELGEARLVAREIRGLLASTPAGRILIATRRLTRAAAELYREVLDEYAIPHDIEGADSLSRVPAVAFLLQAWRLPADDWPFAAIAAILRSSFFRPAWPEMAADPEVAARAETLLRMLGEPRGREAYLRAVKTWDEAPPEPLEDEQPEEPVRQRKQRLAARCRLFLERFFKAWDRLKSGGNAVKKVASLRSFADDIGLSLAACQTPEDARGWTLFWRELERWAQAEAATPRKGLHTDEFARVLTAIASVPCRGRTPRDGGRVSVLSAQTASGLDCDYLFLVGLGERSWPDLSGPVSLLDDRERERLRRLGFHVENPSARLGSEQLLFQNLVSAPRCGLYLSYAAVDEQGQPLLPSSFLRELKNGFPPQEIPAIRQRMLLDGYFDREPLSAAELRVQAAREWNETGPAPPLAPILLAHLQRAARVAQARFRTREFGPFDGRLRNSEVLAELARRFAPEKVFSPTALETYVACPFRFWLEHVLRLKPLEEPAEEIEQTRRGAAFHRALARFHEGLNSRSGESLSGPELPPDVTGELVNEIDRAIEENAARAPSRATAELWRLEGIRLKRAARRYRGHWQEFRQPWRERNITPRPFRFEADFGMPGQHSAEPLLISVAGVDVRIGGRIDRVDLAELEGASGFWVIDYKTGQSINYQSWQVERFEKLQLPLYALAVEKVLFKGQTARPLGLAYWLVTDSGHKGMLPSGKRAALSWLTDQEKWERFRAQLEEWVAALVRHIRGGDFPLSPRSPYCTDTCSFGPVCRIAQSRGSQKQFSVSLPVISREQTETQGPEITTGADGQASGN